MNFIPSPSHRLPLIGYSLLLFCTIFCNAGPAVSRDFQPLHTMNKWVPWSISKNAQPTIEIVRPTELIFRNHSKHMHAAYAPNTLQGSFDVQIDLSEFQGTPGGLILAREKDGKPDPDHYVLLERAKPGDALVVRIRGKIDGLEMEPPFLNLQDSKAEGDPDTLGERLKRGAIALHNDTPTLRIVRNMAGGAIHFQFADRRQIDGKWIQGWTELQTLHDDPESCFFIGVFSRGTKKKVLSPLAFSNARVRTLPARDWNDRDTGFKATRRDYTWSGYSGDAVVVTFDQHADYPEAKFVFWSEANYIPWWHLGDRVALSYEFVEIWGGDTVGCNEPMSDHLLRYTNARIVESNAARVVVAWDYVLVNSAYRWWNNHPTIRPTVREEFTFYPDGTGVRKVIYRPPLENDETHHKWGYELAEILVATGGGTRTAEFVQERALSVIGLGPKQQYDYTWDLSGYDNIDMWRHDTRNWPAVITRANFHEKYPSGYIAFAQDETIREQTTPTVPLKFGGTWELRSRSNSIDMIGSDGRLDFGGFSHWPVMKQPYDNREWIGAVYLREPKHVALISITTGEAGERWPKGPKERTYAMLVGLSKNDHTDEIRARVKSWMYPGTIEVRDKRTEFIGVDFHQRSLRVRTQASHTTIDLRITPDDQLINPVFEIEGWVADSLRVRMNGKLMDAADIRVAKVQQQTVLWLNTTLSSPTDLQFIRK